MALLNTHSINEIKRTPFCGLPFNANNIHPKKQNIIKSDKIILIIIFAVLGR